MKYYMSLIALVISMPFGMSAQQQGQAARLNPPPIVLPGSPPSAWHPFTQIQAQATPGGDKAANTPPAAKTELGQIMAELADKAKNVDAIVGKLRDAAKLKPADTLKYVDQSTQTLAGLIDTVKPDGDLGQQLKALQNAAAIHQQR